MASPLVWKVYDADRDYIAACRYPEDAGGIVANAGLGTVIKVDGRIIWKEGSEQQPASESYDFVTATILTRRRTNWKERQAIYDR